MFARVSNERGKSGAAALSVVSNSVLIVAKLAAAAATGSVAILSEAIHSAIDLVASVVALLSVRKSDEPPDSGHPYGHEKIESLAAVIEGMLILVGAAIIVYEATHRLTEGSSVKLVGLGIAVMGLSFVANVIVSTYLFRTAKATGSAALHADAEHLRTDAASSFAVLIGLTLVHVTGVNELDSAVALAVSTVVIWAGMKILTDSSRVLVDQSLPEHELAMIRRVVENHGAAEVIGFHKLRARGSAGRRHIDMHIQFEDGTSLERAHDVAHELQDEIKLRLGDADVLIHVEPESSSRDNDSRR